MQSRWSLRSRRSVLSIASDGSILSVGSVGSVLSIGSAGSVCSLFSVGLAGSVTSALSFCSPASVRLSSRASCASLREPSSAVAKAAVSAGMLALVLVLVRC